MNSLNSKIHGVLDYLTVALLVGVGLSGYFSAYFSRLVIALGVIHLILTVLTNFKLGVIKLIPLKLHGYVELIVSIALIPIPFILGYSDEASAKLFTWIFAAVVFGLYFLTDYKETNEIPKKS
jgi:hypothetical protein